MIKALNKEQEKEQEEDLLNKLRADLLFDQANSFYEACMVLENSYRKDNNHSWIHVINIDGVFALELYLKAILFRSSVTVPAKHSINQLWGIIPQKVKAQINTTLDSLTEQEKGAVFSIIFKIDGEYTTLRYNEICLGLEPRTIINVLAKLREFYDTTYELLT